MVVPGRDVLDGAVEVDETFLGGVKHGARGREPGGNAIIAVAVESRGTGPGKVRSAVSTPPQPYHGLKRSAGT